LESLAGLVLLSFILLIVLVGGLAFVIRFVLDTPGEPTWRSCVVLCSWIILCVIEWKSVAFYKAVRDTAREPLGINIALSQRHWPVWVSPIVAVWWLINAVSLLLCCEVLLRALNLRGSSGEARVFMAIQLFVFLGASYGTNVLLLLAAAALNRKVQFLNIIWRARVLFDVLLTIFLTYFPVH
jgi:hypothetical protein